MQVGRVKVHASRDTYARQYPIVREIVSKIGTERSRELLLAHYKRSLSEDYEKEELIEFLYDFFLNGICSVKDLNEKELIATIIDSGLSDEWEYHTEQRMDGIVG